MPSLNNLRPVPLRPPALLAFCHGNSGEDAPEVDAAHVVHAQQTAMAHCTTHLKLGGIRRSVLPISAVRHLHLSIYVSRCRAVCDRYTSCTPSETAVAIQRYTACAQGTVTPGSTSSSANPGVPLSSAAGLSLVSCKHIIGMGMRPDLRHSPLRPRCTTGPSDDSHHGLPTTSEDASTQDWIFTPQSMAARKALWHNMRCSWRSLPNLDALQTQHIALRCLQDITAWIQHPLHSDGMTVSCQRRTP